MCHIDSPAAEAAFFMDSAISSELAKKPLVRLPSATMHAPVNVALSTRRSGFSSLAYARTSARTRRPSASVLMISTYLPSIDLKMSPGR